MKIIHCADIHLDSRMDRNFGTERAKMRRAELLETFERMVKFAAEQSVTAILIAGDLFDAKSINHNTALAIGNEIVSHPEIVFYYLRGNHDCSAFLSQFEQLPENLKLFSKEDWTSYQLTEQICISGIELTKENQFTIYDSLFLEKDQINLVLMHGQIAKTMLPVERSILKDETIYLQELKNKFIDYLALGHVHSFESDVLDTRGHYAYSGCLEGRGYDETGVKGFVLLDIDEEKKQVTSQFYPFAKRQIHRVEVDLTGVLSTKEIEDRVLNALDQSDIPETDMVRVALTGSLDSNVTCLGMDQKEHIVTPDLERLDRMINERCLFGKAVNTWSMAIHKEQYLGDISLRGEFVRIAMAETSMDETEREAVILYGLRALSGEDLL